MAIGGLSMGGYGALRLGLKYPDRFGSIWAHSAGIRPLDEAFLAHFDDPDDTSVFHHADRIRGQADLPRLSFDCGVDDSLIEFNRDFHRHLDGIGLPHQYREHPGAHTWDYWDEHVLEALGQHAEVLGIAPVTA
jgi:S-formylglutathione hydrolase FrmB